MSKLKQSLENPETANIIADSLAQLALVAVTLSQLGFQSHIDHATALAEALAGELEALAGDVLQGHSGGLSSLLDEVQNLYNEGDNKFDQQEQG